ncbi:MAG: excinuclease ABC subunit UvrC [Prolixibacteraceae bacterium]|jgi:excinuclease ABC subunit C|nr:excinuclease ABC subunit UvrC [Prolixibacteraceae bacterium]
MDTAEKLKNIVTTLPDEPGIYQFFDKMGTIIYIGKAKRLKKRVSSYFNKNHDHRKTILLVRNISDIKYIVVETEQDALILENNFIKKYQPRYNIQLKDDKTFPWICIKNERFPCVFYTRRVVKDGSQYFGPFTSMLLVRTLIDLFKNTYKLRTCNYVLTEENVSRGKFKVCLQYHIGNCLGPCENHQTESDYNESIGEIRHILKGNIGGVVTHLKEQMQKYAADLDFEQAQNVKDRLDVLQKYQAKSTVVSPTIKNIDVYSYKKEDNISYINFLKIVNGGVIHSFTLEIKSKVDESDEDLLMSGITEIRQKIYSNASELIVPFKPSFVLEDVKYTVPQRGDKKKLLELSKKNVTYFILDKKKNSALKKHETPAERILKTAQKDLRLYEIPFHIECFDNSNLQGTNPVAACVVFKNARPSKRDYRHYNIKTVTGSDDYASMEEVVYRRYKRLLDEGEKLPNLVIVDGGKGQLGAALKALEKLELRSKLPIIGIAKRLEEIFYPGDPVPLYIDKNSETLKLIQKLRDEAHRFGITHHRSKRDKLMTVSELDKIRGIGTKTKEVLLQKYKSLEAIKNTSDEELEKEIGKNKVKIIQRYFNRTN